MKESLKRMMIGAKKLWSFLARFVSSAAVSPIRGTLIGFCFFFADVSHVTVMCDSVLSSFVFRIDIFTTQITVKVEKLKELILFYLYSIEVVAGLGCHCDKS